VIDLADETWANITGWEKRKLLAVADGQLLREEGRRQAIHLMLC